MFYTLERFEDAGLAVLETDTGDSLTVNQAELPSGARAGDVLVELPWYRPGTVRYTVDKTLSEARRGEAEQLRAELPVLRDEGDIEL